MWDSDTENLIMLDFPGDFTHHQAFKQKLNQFAFVESSSFSSGAWGNMNLILDEGTDFKLREIKVDSDFIKTLGIKIIKGRSFLKGDKEKAFIFNETAYKKIEREDKDQIQFQGNKVIGLTGDFHTSSFHSAIEPVGLLLSDDSMDKIFVRLTPGDSKDKLKKINQLWTEFITDKPFNFIFIKSWFDNLYIDEIKADQSDQLIWDYFIVYYLSGHLWTGLL